MKRLLLILLLILIVSCKTNKKSKIATINSSYKATKNENTLNYFDTQGEITDLYDLSIASKKIKNNIFEIVISINLHNGSYFVSPNAERDFKGKFKILLDKNNKVNFLNKLIETPLSVEEIDHHPFVNGAINWVKVNTKYQQQIKLNSSNDFEVNGIIQFTIEPKCTLEKIPFVLKYTNGNFKVEKIMC